MRKTLTMGATTVFLVAALTLSCSDSGFLPYDNSASDNQDSRIDRYRVEGIIWEIHGGGNPVRASDEEYEVKFYFYHPMGMEYVEITDENPPCTNDEDGYYDYNGDDGEGYPLQYLYGKVEAWHLDTKPPVLKYTEYFYWDTFEYLEKNIFVVWD